jgi:hypothetical protein
MSVACVMRPDSSSSLGMYTIVPAGQGRIYTGEQGVHRVKPTHCGRSWLFGLS